MGEILASDLGNANSKSPVWTQMVVPSSDITDGGALLRTKALADAI